MRTFSDMLEQATRKAEESSGPHQEFWRAKVAEMAGPGHYESQEHAKEEA